LFTFSLSEASKEKEENEDDTGYLYDSFEKIKDVISEFNDSVKGRCNICFGDFYEEGRNEAFTDRVYLTRVDECFHKFHLLCLWRFWFMPRHKEKD